VVATKSDADEHELLTSFPRDECVGERFVHEAS
jgi:hypothetical protein